MSKDKVDQAPFLMEVILQEEPNSEQKVPVTEYWGGNKTMAGWRLTGKLWEVNCLQGPSDKFNLRSEGQEGQPNEVLGGGENLSSRANRSCKGPDPQADVRQPCLCYSRNSFWERNHQTENKFSRTQKEQNILSKESQLECVSTGNR